MNTSIFLAQAFSLYLVIVAIAMLWRKELLCTIIKDLIASPATIFTIAIVTLILGIVLVLSHNIWVMGWPVAITLLSWATLIAGIIRTFFPSVVIKAGTHLITNNTAYHTASIITLVLGIFLGYVGFF